MKSSLIKLLLLIVATPLIAFSGASIASPVTYQVNRTITNDGSFNPTGTVGTVTGSITTDGTLGILAVGNVTGWSLTLDDGVLAAFTIHQGNSVFAFDTPNSLVATISQLTFDFGSYGDLLFNHPQATSDVYWGLEGTSGTRVGACDSCETVRTKVGSPASWTTQSRSGVVVVAQVQPVPEPGSVALVTVALAGLALSRRRLQPR